MTLSRFYQQVVSFVSICRGCWLCWFVTAMTEHLPQTTQEGRIPFDSEISACRFLYPLLWAGDEADTGQSGSEEAEPLSPCRASGKESQAQKALRPGCLSRARPSTSYFFLFLSIIFQYHKHTMNPSRN